MAEPSPKNVFRSTSVLTARNGTIRYFRSPDEVPQELQRDIDKALQGSLTANIILADEGGQRYLQSRPKAPAPVESQIGWRRLLARRLIFEAAGALLVAATIWALAAAR